MRQTLSDCYECNNSLVNIFNYVNFALNRVSVWSVYKVAIKVIGTQKLKQTHSFQIGEFLNETKQKV